MKQTKEQIKQFAKAINEGQPLKKAMVEVLGLSENTAVRGKAGLSKAVLAELMKHGVEFARLGREITPEMQEQFVRGRLFHNAIQGKDAAVNSLKLLGQDKRVNMFTPDSVSGIVVIESPRALPDLPNRISVTETVSYLPQNSNIDVSATESSSK